MKQFFTCMFLLCLTLSTQAFAGNLCEAQLTRKKYSAVEQNFSRVIESLRALGLTHLLAPLDRGEVTVSFRSPRRWFPGLPLQNVRGKKTFFGGNKLIVRRLDLSDTKKTQQAMWEVALALYQMHVDKRLFAIRSMLPQTNQRQFALTPDGEDEILAYFLHELPIEWRDERLRDIATLEQELYRLLASMDQWSDEDLLAARDGGRWWLARAVVGSDASQWIRPNRRDFERWKSEAGLNLQQTLDKRHRHSVLFNYYFNYLKRYMLVMMTASVVAYAPQLTELPGQALQAYRFYELTQQSAGMSEALNDSFLAHLAEENARERDSLVAEMNRLKASGDAETAVLAQLADQLADLCDSAPELQCQPPGR